MHFTTVVTPPQGKPTGRLDVVKAAAVARLTQEDWQKTRDKMLATCGQCHSRNFARAELEKGDQMIRETDRLMAEAIRTVAKSKVWLEIVYLVIPTLNDRMDLIREMAKWVRGEAGEHVPVHFSRFNPMYLVKNLPPTPLSTLESARRTALEEGLRFVYVGNVPGHGGESTYCPGCGGVAVGRVGYSVESVRIKKGKCEKCGTPIPGIWA